jgi:RHH-type transcriptional regulator, rel operon repressor / antitoxin RelB
MEAKLLVQGDEIYTPVSIRLPDDMADRLKSLSETIDRSKAYVIKKALQAYLDEYSDYLIAQERLKDENDISSIWR